MPRLRREERVETPFVIVELDHVVLRCRDQERTLDFYTRILGLREERRLEAIGLGQLRAGTSLLDLVPAEGVEFVPNMDHFCLAIETPDLERVQDHLRRSGVELVGEPMVRYGARGYGFSIYLRDPEGNVVELKSTSPAPDPFAAGG